MNIERVYQGLREMHNFADESVKLYREGQFMYANLKARRECLKKLIIQCAELTQTLTEAAQELEGVRNGTSITEHS